MLSSLAYNASHHGFGHHDLLPHSELIQALGAHLCLDLLRNVEMSLNAHKVEMSLNTHKVEMSLNTHKVEMSLNTHKVVQSFQPGSPL